MRRDDQGLYLLREDNVWDTGQYYGVTEPERDSKNTDSEELLIAEELGSIYLLCSNPPGPGAHGVEQVYLSDSWYSVVK